MKTKRINLNRLLFKSNPPSGLNPYVVMSLAYVLRSHPADVEPIVVRKEGRFYRIMDGRHRAVASMMAGRKNVLAVVEKSR